MPSFGQIAQLVEQRTENPCVPGSIPGLAKIHLSMYLPIHLSTFYPITLATLHSRKLEGDNRPTL